MTRLPPQADNTPASLYTPHIKYHHASLLDFDTILDDHANSRLRQHSAQPIATPKKLNRRNAQCLWDSFYAGFSEQFVTDVINTLKPAPDATILDCWNGSGTTTSVASALSYEAYGFDINPAMVMLAKARLAIFSPWTDLADILGKLAAIPANLHSTLERADPLLLWFTPKSTNRIRHLERVILSALAPNVAQLAASTANP